MGQTTEVTRELKHVTVREHVRSLLKDAAPGTPAPSERELVQQFGVARMTVRQALDALVVDGLLERVPGRGTFVAQPTERQSQVAGFSEAVVRRGQVPESQTLLVRVEQAGPGVARALRIETGSPVIHWKRVRRAGGEVICVQDTYLDETIHADLLQGALPDSLYAALADRGLRPTSSEDSVRADMPSDEERALLELDESLPVLRVARRGVIGSTVVEVSRTVYRSDRHTLYLQLGEQA